MKVSTDYSNGFFENDIIECRYIEGLSNEVTLAFTAILCFIGTTVWYYWKYKNDARVSVIHPQLASDVNDFRSVLLRANAPYDEENIQRLVEARDRSDRMCPICFGPASFGILTNCGHVFCCECIIGYWQHSASPVTPVNCAICRTPVTMLLPVDWPSQNRADYDDVLLGNDIRLNDYNRRFSGGRPWMDYLYDLPVLIPYALNHITDLSGLLVVFRLRVFLCFLVVIIYILTPFDVIPESAYGLMGFLDDMFILSALLFYLCIVIRQYMAGRGRVPQDIFQY